MTAASIPFVRRRARMGRYALWQSGDFVLNTMLITLVLFGLIGVLTIMNLRAMESYYAMRRPPQPMPLVQKLSGFLQAYGMFVTVAPIICLSGVVSQDRTSGYTRFLFSKPVSPRWYYLQSFAVKFAGFLVMAHLLLFAWAYFEPPTYTPRLLVDLTISFLSIGGVVFLLSVVSRFDGLIAVLVLLVSAVLWSKWEKVTGIKHWITWLLPPVEKSGDMHNWVVGMNTLGQLGNPEFPWKWAMWSGGYGLACLVLGLYLLRRVPLTKA